MTDAYRRSLHSPNLTATNYEADEERNTSIHRKEIRFDVELYESDLAKSSVRRNRWFAAAFLFPAFLTFASFALLHWRDRAVRTYQVPATPILTVAASRSNDLAAEQTSALPRLEQRVLNTHLTVHTEVDGSQILLQAAKRELKRTLERNRRLEALVQILRERRSKSYNTFTAAKVKLISNSKR